MEWSHSCKKEKKEEKKEGPEKMEKGGGGNSEFIGVLGREKKGVGKWSGWCGGVLLASSRSPSARAMANHLGRGARGWGG